MLSRLILQVWTSGGCYRASPIPGAEQGGLLGLVEAHVVEGETLAGMTNKIDVGLDHVSRGLRDLLPRIPTPQGT